MKKILSLALAMVICLSLTVPALAAGKTGDTTVKDVKGNTYTLSSPILYTTSPKEVGIFIEDNLYGVSTIYAVPVGTLVEVPSGIKIRFGMEVQVAWENGKCYSIGEQYHENLDATWVQCSTANEFVVMRCYSYDGQLVDTIAFFASGENTSTNPFTPTSSSKPAFTDVADSAYYAAPVAWAVENGITSGTTTTTFSPNATCTTAQILTFLWRAKGSPEPTSKTNTFTDIKESDYYYKAALWAKENGLISGTTFNGSTPCTRAATVTYLWKLAGSPSAASASFTDVPVTAKYSQAVAWAVSKGVTSGTSATTFSPDTTCTRAQIVTFLYRAYAD